MFCFSDLPDASAVHGILTKDGLFDGHISTPLEEYYIEPASRYFTNTKNVKKKKDSDQPQQGPLFHSVIYKASDVVHPTASPTSEDGSSEVIYTLHHTTVWSVNNVAVKTCRKVFLESTVSPSLVSRWREVFSFWGAIGEQQWVTGFHCV